MPGEQRPGGLHRLDARALPPAPTAFATAVLPCFRDRQIIPSGGHERFRGVGHELAINVQCPRETLDDYVGLLAREAALLRARLSAPLPVVSLWLRGSPSRQFSPEAVTELIFRLNAQFPLSSTDAVRGLELPAAAINPERLALLAGLGFNRVALRIDATLGSDERSLGRLHDLQRQLTDFPAIELQYEVRFGSRSHPRYLSRLLAALRSSPAAAIELVDPDQENPRPLAERLESGQLLKLAVAEMTAAGWAAFGNHIFVPADSALAGDRCRDTLHLTPWGPQPLLGRLWLGLGVGAFGYLHPCYYRTTPRAESYRQALEAMQLPDKELYGMPGECLPTQHLCRALLCSQRLPPAADPELHSALAEQQWIQAESGRLTTAGIIQLAAIIHDLHLRSDRGEDHAQFHTSDHHGA
ncbi:MAG: hypothetical protein ACOY42_02730 [Pseudomonadota bacterium]